MCNPASFVITRERVYWSKDGDSHNEIISENGLGALDLPGRVDLLRCEIVPPKCDYSQPLDKWIFNTDQDVLPDWYSREWCEGIAREELMKWATHHIISDDGEYAISDGMSRIVLRGASTLTVSGGEVRTYDQSAPTIINAQKDKPVKQ